MHGSQSGSPGQNVSHHCAERDTDLEKTMWQRFHRQTGVKLSLRWCHPDAYRLLLLGDAICVCVCVYKSKIMLKLQSFLRQQKLQQTFAPVGGKSQYFYIYSHQDSFTICTSAYQVNLLGLHAINISLLIRIQYDSLPNYINICIFPLRPVSACSILCGGIYCMYILIRGFYSSF